MPRHEKSAREMAEIHAVDQLKERLMTAIQEEEHTLDSLVVKLAPPEIADDQSLLHNLDIDPTSPVRPYIKHISTAFRELWLNDGKISIINRGGINYLYSRKISNKR